MDWPTGQEVNRQPRALQSVLLFGVIAATGWCWYSGQGTPDESSTEIVVSDVATRGGRFVSSLRSEPRSFNRHVRSDFPIDLYQQLTGSKLVRVNRVTAVPEPALAEKWSTSPDNRTFTLTLREGVVWSDGTPFTADDVLFSFEATYDPRAKSALASSMVVGGKPLEVSSPDPRTVVVTYPSTFGPGISLLDNLPIMPKHKLQAALKAGTFRDAFGVATPPEELVVLGPFKLSSYVPGQRLIFDRNPRYWKKDEAGVQLPYVDQLVLEVVPDQNAELVRLQSGQFDMLQQAVRAEDLATLKPLVSQGRLEIIDLGVGTDPDLLFFNLRSPYWAKDPRGRWIMRKEFRRAISHAIDREAYANTIYLGAGVPIWGPVTPGNAQWFSPNVPRYGYSLDRAREILAGLGLANRDADEWLEDDKGTEARFTVLTYKGNTSLERGSALLRDELKKVGIAVDVVMLEQGALVSQMVKGDFDAIFFFITATNLDPSMNLDFWLSSGGSHIWNMAQGIPATDWEKEIDDLMLALTAETDHQERRRLFDQVQRIFADNLPAIYFVAPRLNMAVTRRLGGLTPSVLRPQLLWNAERTTVRDAAR